MNCPFCNVALHPFQEAGLHLDRCPTGHGIWFDGDELTAYRKTHPEVGMQTNDENKRFVALPGMPIKNCPRCELEQLQGGRLHESDVWQCFTCKGVFLGHPLPVTQDPLNPTPIIVGSFILHAILGGLG